MTYQWIKNAWRRGPGIVEEFTHEGYMVRIYNDTGGNGYGVRIFDPGLVHGEHLCHREAGIDYAKRKAVEVYEKFSRNKNG